MKTFFLFFCLLTLNFLAPAQIAFYAAKGINDNCVRKDTSAFRFKGDPVSINKLSSYLKDFLPEAIRNDSTLVSDQVFDHFNDNPFFGPQIIAVSGGSSGFISGKFSSFASSIGGVDVSKYANALSDILIERAKQELTVAFFNRFRKFSEDNPEFKILFPETTENLNELLSYKYAQMLPELRNGFYQDLKQVTYRLDDVLGLPRYQTLLANFPEARVAIKSLRLVHEIETGASNAADIIKAFAEFEEWEDENHRKLMSVGSCVKIASLFSESIRNDSSQSHTDDVWVSSKELKELFHDEILFNIYMGLLYQQSKNKDIEYIPSEGEAKKFYLVLDEQRSNLFLFQLKLKEFFDLTGNVNTSYKNFKEAIDDNRPSFDENIFDYINTTIEVIDYSFSIPQIFKEDTIAVHYLDLLYSSNNLFKSIYTEQYTQAVNDLLDVFSTLNDLIDEKIQFKTLTKDQDVIDYSNITNKKLGKLIGKDKKFCKIEKNYNSLLMTEISNENVQSIMEHYSLKSLTAFAEKVKPYALFMANAVEAKEESEIKAALENVILPVGSSSIKKNSIFNISIQSYLGGYARMGALNTNYDNAWSSDVGVIAPIGFALSWGIPPKWGAASLFIPLLDLSAIVDYKLTTETVSTPEGMDTTVVQKDYKIELGQIFSPGCYFVYGFPWSLPISFGIGGQYGPGLNKVSTDNTTIVNDPQWRWNVFLAVDIPLFNLTNVPRNKPRKK